MRYNNLPCPKCGRIMNEEDDIVVCPDCATPQHRSCWLEDGHCVNHDKHSGGYVWTPEQNEAQPREADEPSGGMPQSKICHVCGSENPEEALHCGNCGALFGSENADPTQPKQCRICGRTNDGDAVHCKYCGAPFAMDSPFVTNPYLAASGIDEKETIGGMEAGDIAYYVQPAAPRYIKKFRKISEGKKLSFNWAAFFFAPYWFLYRKMYKVGIIFMLIFAAVSFALTPPMTNYAEAAESFYSAIESNDITDEQAEALMQELTQATQKYAPVIIGVSLLVRLISGFSANPLYYKKMKKDYALICEQAREPMGRRLLLGRRGGASAMLFAAGFFGYNCIISILTYIADAIIADL